MIKLKLLHLALHMYLDLRISIVYATLSCSPIWLLTFDVSCFLTSPNVTHNIIHYENREYSFGLQRVMTPGVKGRVFTTRADKVVSISVMPAPSATSMTRADNVTQDCSRDLNYLSIHKMTTNACMYSVSAILGIRVYNIMLTIMSSASVAYPGLVPL